LKIIFFFVLILLSALIFLKITNQNQAELDQKITPTVNEKPKVVIGNATIFVDVAKTTEDQQKGLSGRESLQQNEGMLFLFEDDTYQGFWMKDMLIPIDIIWIKDGRIIYIHNNVNPQPGVPDEKLTLYAPPVAIDRVLEVNAGFSERNGIEVGDSVDISALN